jgi:predicted membrane protein
METSNSSNERFVSPRSGRSFAGLILVVIGGVLLGRQVGFDIPEWVLTWEVLLIALGLFFGARRGFRQGSWVILILVGGAFLINDVFPEFNLQEFVWPIAIILFGIWMIMRPSRKPKFDWKEYVVEEVMDGENKIEANSVFGGSKKKIVSKDFKGGEINSVFGGNDLDFSQADINGKAVLELNIVFGGAKLIVPAHWKIHSEIDSVFGSVEDKRRDSAEVDQNKTLVLKGAVVFGGIEIKSY